MGFRFEFDAVNKILLLRVEGPFTNELAKEIREVARELSAASEARAAIVDLSSVTEFLVSTRLLTDMADQQPAMGTVPRIVVAPSPVGFGLSRMFQTVRQPKASLMEVVHTLDEAFAALGVQSPHFEPLE